MAFILTQEGYLQVLQLSGIEALLDHGLITGLGDDDHELYILADGSRDFTGNVTIKHASEPWLLVEDTDNTVQTWLQAQQTYGLVGTSTAHDFLIFAHNYIALQFTDTGALVTAPSLVVKDEDDMASDSDVHLATQQSIKKYVDDSVVVGSFIADADSDTKFQTEEAADEDIARIDAGGNEIWIGRAAGEITKPLQPAFAAAMTVDQDDLVLSEGQTIQFDEVTYNQGGDYNNSTYMFTAPVGGKYLISACVYMHDVDLDATYFRLGLISSNRNYLVYDEPWKDADLTYYSMQISVVVDMDASDTCKITMMQVGGAAIADVSQAASRFMGYLLG